MADLHQLPGSDPSAKGGLMIMKEQDEKNVHRLAGSSGQEKGGLFIMKKGPSSDSEKIEFKV